MHVEVRHGHLRVGPHVEDQSITTLANPFEFDDLLSQQHEVIDDAAVARGDFVRTRDVAFEMTSTCTGAWGAMS